MDFVIFFGNDGKVDFFLGDVLGKCLILWSEKIGITEQSLLNWGAWDGGTDVI